MQAPEHCREGLDSFLERSLDVNWYGRLYTDLAGMTSADLKRHFRDYGFREGRSPNSTIDPSRYRARNGHWSLPEGANFLAHYHENYRSGTVSPSVLFNVPWYLAQMQRRGVPLQEPTTHFRSAGWRQGFTPHPLFDQRFYLTTNDVDLEGLDPLAHYLLLGSRLGLRTSPIFDGRWYLDFNPDVRAAAYDPLMHYLEFGYREGRFTTRYFQGRIPTPAPPEPGERGYDDPLSRMVVAGGLFPDWMPPPGSPNRVVDLADDPAEVTIPYLANGLSRRDRICCFFNHLVWFAHFFSGTPRQNRRGFDIVLHRELAGDVEHAICLHAPLGSDNEGELSLSLRSNGEMLYQISFTLVPGWVVGLDRDQAILISRMQGRGGMQAQIRAVTKAMHQTSPQAVLFQFLQGIALASGVDHIASVDAEAQICFKPNLRAVFAKSYDEFLVSVGATRSRNNFLVVALPLTHKQISAIKPGHRLRTRAKREFKDKLTTIARRAWAAERGVPDPDAAPV